MEKEKLFEEILQKHANSLQLDKALKVTKGVAILFFVLAYIIGSCYSWGSLGFGALLLAVIPGVFAGIGFGCVGIVMALPLLTRAKSIQNKVDSFTVAQKYKIITEHLTEQIASETKDAERQQLRKVEAEKMIEECEKNIASYTELLKEV